MGDQPGQIDRSLYAGVAAADHRHALALEQRTIAMRAIGHAPVTIGFFAGHVHLAPARAGGQDEGTSLQHGTVLERNLVKPAQPIGRHQLYRLLQVHHIDFIIADMLLQRGRELRAFSVLHRDEVLDPYRIEHLATKSLGGDAGTDALARGVDRCRCPRRAAADHEHLERFLRRNLLRRACRSTGIQLCEDLLDVHPALPERLTIQEDSGDRHDLARIDFILERAALDCDMADPGVQHAHQIQRLHNIRAVLARQREIAFKGIVAVQRPDMLDDLLRQLGRMTADLEQRQHQRRELVAHRQSGKTHPDIGTLAADHERGPAPVVIVADDLDVAGKLGDLIQQRQHLARSGTIVCGRDEFDRQFDITQVSLELGFQVCIEHVTSPVMGRAEPAATGSAIVQILPTRSSEGASVSSPSSHLAGQTSPG